MDNLCANCRRIEEYNKLPHILRLAYMLAENNEKLEVNISPRRQKTAHDILLRKILQEHGGLYVTLDGVIDYSTNPPIFKPNEKEICGIGDLSEHCVIFDDIHNLDLQEK